MATAIGLLVGLLVGVVVVWALLRARSASLQAAHDRLAETEHELRRGLQDARQCEAEAYGKFSEAQQRLVRASADIEHERQVAAERLATATERAEADFERLAGERDATRGELATALGRVRELEAQLTEETEGLRSNLVKLQADLEREQALAAEKVAVVEQLNERYAETFKALSSEALQANNESFLTLAKQAFTGLQADAKGDLDKRQDAIAQLVAPVTDTLKRVDGQLVKFDADRRETQGALSAQLRQVAESQERLRGETGNLVAALRQPQTRGRWGEMQLRRVVEVAGMLAHCDFVEQSTLHAGGRTLRPDLLVSLPAGKQVVVDAKAPLQAYLDAAEAKTDEEREQHLRAHARQLRDHLRKLGAKSYWSQFPDTPDFVVMFLPGEQFSAAALQQDPSLIEEGVNQCVFLATPMTLITLLRAVAYGWQQDKVAESARAISELGRELHTRLVKLGEHVHALGRRLNSSIGAYNDVVGSLESRVLPSARKFSDHGAVSAGKELPSLAPVAGTARSVQVSELAERAPRVITLPASERAVDGDSDTAGSVVRLADGDSGGA